MTNGKQQTSRRIVVNIENDTSAPPIYLVTPDRLNAALGPHKELAEVLDIRIGTDYADFERVMQRTEVLFAWLGGRKFSLDLLTKSPTLKWMHYIGSGVDGLMPLNWLPPGAVLTKSLGAHMPIAAEFGLMALLMLNNKVPWYTIKQREHKWDRRFATSVTGKTVAVIGVGHIGGAIAGLAKKLGFKVIGIRRSGEPHEHVDEMFGPESLHKVLARADFVLLSAASTHVTRGLIGRKELESMKSGAGLASIVRGEVIDWEALRAKLSDGHLSGAVINGHEFEPLPSSSPTWDAPNLVITQHTATQGDDDYMIKCLDVFFRNMKLYLAGKPLLYQSDPALGY